jgi:hypothetical protein
VTPEETAPPPPLRFAPTYYFTEAFKILTWDDAAVRRASRDNNSLIYGFLIIAIGTALQFVPILLRSLQLNYPIPLNLLMTRYAWVLVYSLVWIIAQIGLSHVLARIFFDAKGSYLSLMRAYLLGQMYRWLIFIPVIGGMLIGLGGIAVLMMVFEEVDEIERMKAFGLAATIGIIFWIASVWALTTGPRPIR